MRICFVSQEYPPETAKGGIGTQAYAKAHGMAALGHEVLVISRSTDDQRHDRCEGAVAVLRIPASRTSVHTEVADWVSYSAAVAEAVASEHERHPIDLVEFPEWGCEGYVHLLNQTEWNRIPTAVHLHGPLVMLARTIGWPDVESELFRIGMHMEAACLRLADAIYSSSICSAEWVSREYNLRQDMIPVLHTGVDLAHFAPRPVEKEARPTIVFAGKIVENKGVGVLLDAVMDLARDIPDLRVRMLGRGDKAVVAGLQSAAERRGMSQVLDLPGFVDRRDLPDQLSRAEVFAAPSQYEGGPGFVYLEAMACGIPVIACTGSGAAEVVRHGDTGLLVPPNDVNALSKSLRRLLSNRGEAKAMGARARDFVASQASSMNCMKRLEQFYLATVAASAGNCPSRPPSEPTESPQCGSRISE